MAATKNVIQDGMTSRSLVGEPVNMESFEQERTRRKAERDAKRAVLDECLDSRIASQYELEKPRFEFEVDAVFRAPDANGNVSQMSYCEKVIAQNESDAWATFCDSIGRWPGRRSCSTLEITKGREVRPSEAFAQETKPHYLRS